MSVRVSLMLFCMLFYGGCVYKDEPIPRITSVAEPEAVRIEHAERVREAEKVAAGAFHDWVPKGTAERKWSAIIIHHSATGAGNSEIFDRWHREGNNWDGVGYDFVIGNGTDSGDGEVEVTFRWRQQRTGAHCGGTPGNWANSKGIGICLVGDFNRTRPTTRQLESLAALVDFLRERYGIGLSRIYGHGATPGARNTECPGRYFPMGRFKAMLD